MKPLLLLLIWLVAGGAAAAQAHQPNLRSAPLATAPVAPDTVAALHRLFANRRQRRNILAAGAVGAALVGTAVAPSDGFFSTADYAKLYGVGAAAIIAVDFVFSMDYSRKNEQLAIESFQAHQLSRHLKRRLKSRYFR